MGITRGRSLGTRLLRLQDQLQALPRPPEEPRDEDDWLAIFEELGRDGIFDAESDFPVALAFFRDALARAHASIDPPFDPPPDFQPEQRFPHLRRECWRTGRFPDIDEGFMWLAEMSDRVDEGIPPVSEAEFRELTVWFAANDARLQQLLPNAALDVGNGRRLWCSNIRYYLAKGPRADGAGQLAEDIRQLKHRYSV